ncbi:hypothetical protein STANM309S_03147 [Streptomyces tanashiensis]
MQHPRRRIRRPVALAATTALSLTLLASASNTLPGPAPASAGPVAAAQRRSGTPRLGQSEGRPGSAGPRAALPSRGLAGRRTR